MRLETFQNNKYYICKPLSEEIKKEDFGFFKKILKKNSNKRIAFDFSKIQKVHHSFFKLLEEFKISLFALNSTVLAYFSLCNSLNLAYIYTNENDFLTDKRTLAKRNFHVIK